jgi:plasmid maintenance system antidote protein VapI
LRKIIVDKFSQIVHIGLMEIEYGKQRRLALAVGLSAQAICQYLAGNRNAIASMARRLGAETGSDPFIWMLADDETSHAANVARRRAAVAAWEPPGVGQAEQVA